MRTGKIEINDINGGWSFGFNKYSNRSAQSNKQGTYYTGLFSTTRAGYEGLMGDAMGEIVVSTAMNSLLVNATNASDGNAYAIGQNGEIVQITLPTGLGSTYAAPASVTTDQYKDIWTHVDTTGTEAMFFTYQTGASAFVGYKQVATVTRNDTYITLTNRNVPHVGVVSTGNKSYITDGNLVRAYDPAVGATTTNVNLGLGWVAVSVADAGSYCAIVGNQSSGSAVGGAKARLWLWNGTGTSYNYQYDIRDGVVTAVTNEGGVIKVFCTGKNGTTKIKTFSGNNFSEEADFEVDNTYSDSPAHNMVDIWMNQLAWRTQSGYVWTYGSVKKDQFRTGAHRIAQISTDASQGFVKNLYGSNLYLSKKVGSVYTLVYLSPANSSSVTSSFVSDLYQLPHKSTIQYIEVVFAKYVISGGSTSANSFSLSLFKGDDTTDQIAASVPLDNALQGTRLYYFPIRKKVSDVDTFYLSATWTGIIKEIIVHYAYEDNAL